MHTRALILMILPLTLAMTGCPKCSPQRMNWKGIQNDQLKVHDVSEQNQTDTIATWSAQTDTLQIKVVRRAENSDGAKTLLRGIQSSLQSFYEDGFLPYAGYVSKKTACPDPFKPREFSTRTTNEKLSRAWMAFSNDRFVMGVCDPTQAAYRALHGVVACTVSNLSFEIKLYERLPSPPNDDLMNFDNLTKIFEAFHCL